MSKDVSREAAKPRREFPMPRFSPEEFIRAHQEWGCNCGPSALAAIADISLNEAGAAIPNFDEKHYTNPTMMKSALMSLGVDFIDLYPVWPHWGLVRIQWEGPWTMPGAPAMWAYRQTHWVGTALDLNNGKRGIFDCNAMGNGTGWASFRDWCDHIVPYILADIPRSTGGWHVTHCFSLPLRGFAPSREKNGLTPSREDTKAEGGEA